jgi:alpha-galactosidase
MPEVGNGGMSDAEYRAHFSSWAMLAAPLIAGNDLSNMSAATRAILLNKEIIAIDQDTLGIQAHRAAKRVTRRSGYDPLSAAVARLRYSTAEPLLFQSP